MSKSTLSTLIIAAMCTLCLSSVAHVARLHSAPQAVHGSLSDQAAAAVATVMIDEAPAASTPSPVAQAAEAAGEAMSSIEMPFFSFGGATRSE